LTWWLRNLKKPGNFARGDPVGFAVRHKMKGLHI
jgi:hypothetical protein